MAADQVPAEIEADLVTGTEIDYRPKTFENGSYRYTRILPVQGPRVIDLSATAVGTTTIELPAKVFNLSKSQLRFNMTLNAQGPEAANVGPGLAIHADTIPCIDRLSLFTRSGIYICDITNFNTFMKVTNKWTQSVEELCSNDVGEPLDYGTTANPYVTTRTNGFQACRSAAFNLPQQQKIKRLGLSASLPADLPTLNAAMKAGTLTTPGVFVDAIDADHAASTQSLASAIGAFGSQINQLFNGNYFPPVINGCGTIPETEQRYVFTVGRASGMSADSATHLTSLQYLIKLGQIPHSIFAVNKDLYFGETLVLQINWATTPRIAYKYPAYTYAAGATGDNTHAAYMRESHPNNVSVDDGNLVTDNTAFNKIYDCQLYLAVETNRLLIETIVRQMSTNGLRVLCPYMIAQKYTSTASETQNVQQRLNRAWGRSLLRVYHSVFNESERNHLAYDNNNLDGAKVKELYTTLDNDRLQESNLVAYKTGSTSANEDYQALAELIKGTSYQSPTHFQMNWSWVDDWTGRSPVHHRVYDIAETGLSLSTERLWQIYLSMTSAAYNHYSFFITQKLLTITPSQIMII